MSYRRRHRWLRRLALGLAFASFASPAAARPDEQGGSARVAHVTAGGWSGAVDAETGIPLSAGITGELRFESATVLGESARSKADVAIAPAELTAGTRPDDRSNRFAHSDAAPGRSQLVNGTDWNVGLALGLGLVAFALALGMALGYISRPRIAGMH